VRPGLQMHGSYEEAAAAVEAVEAADAAAQRSRGGLATVAEDEKAGDSGDEEAGDSAAGSDDEGALLSAHMPFVGHGVHNMHETGPHRHLGSPQPWRLLRLEHACAAMHLCDPAQSSATRCRRQGWSGDVRRSRRRRGGALRMAAPGRMMTRRRRRGCCGRRPPRPTRTSSESSPSSSTAASPRCVARSPACALVACSE
jgi:hypothetical protein